MRPFLIFLFLFPICAIAQQHSTNLSKYNNSMRVEKLYMAHDKPFYIPGDIIWAKMWMINGITHKHLESNELVYVDWVDPSGKVVLSDIVQLEDGRGDFSIETERVSMAGDYTLRAYTYYQLGLSKAYLFQKSIKLINGQESIGTEVVDVNGSFNVQVFPEGGYLIHGLTSQVAFEVRDSSGYAQSTNVQVVDDLGQIMGLTHTNNNGIGLFNLQPTIGKKYYLKLDGAQKIEVPKCLVAGAVMSIDAIDVESINIGIDFSESIKNQVFKIIGHVRGREVLNLDVKTSGNFNYKIDRNQVPSGVIHFTLFDAYDRPISERLVFNNNPDEDVDVDVNLSKENYERGEEIDGEISVSMNGLTAPSSVIMSVYNANLLDLDLNDLDIRNYLLLQSDMAQPISNLASYFHNGKKDHLANMDLLMMTQYWRRFNWLTMDALVEHMTESAIEDSYTIIGKVVNRYTKKPVKANVILTALDKNGGFVNTSHATEDDGLFMFRGLDLRDSTDMFIQAGTYRKPSRKEKKKDNIEIRGNQDVLVDWIRYERNLIDMDMTYSSSLRPLPIEEDMKQIQRNSIEAKTYISSYNLEGEEWNIDLEAVTVSANRNKAEQRDQDMRNRYKQLGLVFVHRTEKHEVPIEFLEESYHLDIFDVIARIVPSAQTMDVDGQKTITTTKSSIGKNNTRKRSAFEDYPPGEPLIVVNGQPLDRGFVAQIDPEYLLYIDIIKGREALAIYNSKRTVYNLLLKEGVSIFKEKINGNLAIMFPGYHNRRIFYRKSNVSTENDKDGNDYSTTLYWNPDINVTNKPFSFEFKTSDLPGRHCIYIQGLTNEGIPFVSKRYFVVE